MCKIFFFNDTATTEIYTLSLHDALPIYTILLIKLKKQLNEESSNISKRIIKYWVKIINSIKNDKENE